MPRIGLFNMTFGFLLIFLAASGGAFVAVNATQRFLEGEMAARWGEVLQASSHGHTALFGLIHILFGLTLPYSFLSQKIKILQTMGIAFGALAMGPMMLARSAFGPTNSFEVIGVMLGVMLSLALCAICIHVYGLMFALIRRQ
ncbi:MAG: hypothetical protein NTV34_17755 [Proteobacteria bacterium]|nr:hypothetical protein [Pseudomonadota bacterium]